MNRRKNTSCSTRCADLKAVLKTLIGTAILRLSTQTLAGILFVSLSCFFQSYPPVAWAEPDLLQIRGLTLRCAGCVRRSETECEITVQGERTITHCISAVELLLHNAARVEYDGEHPAADELRTFLLLEAPNPTEAKAALELLCRSTVGRTVFSANAGKFVTKYDEQLVPLAASRRCPPEIWSELWRLPTISGVPLSSRLLATIAGTSTTLGLTDLLGELSVVDIENDLQQLTIFRETLADLNNPWAEDLRTLEARLAECQPQFGADLAPAHCAANGFNDLAAPAAQYLGRVQTHAIIERLKSEPFAVATVMRALSQIDVVAHRTPEGHKFIVLALKAALKDDAAREEAIADRYQAMLEAFAANDAEISRILASLLVQTARKVAEEGDLNRAVSYAERSLKIHPERLEERERVLDTLSSHPFLAKSPECQQRLARLRKGEIVQPPKKSESKDVSTGMPRWQWMMIGLAIALIVFLGLSVVRSLMRVKEEKKQQILSEEERRELQALYKFFQLSPASQARDLTRQFHLMAKTMHPDTGGDVRRFNDLTERYQRAMELLTKR